MPQSQPRERENSEFGDTGKYQLENTMQLSSTQFVNIHGQQWTPSTAMPKIRPKPAKEKFHKGFRVVGLPPGSMDEARIKHDKQQVDAKEPKPFSESHWLANAHAKPVRSKPYEIQDSARQCALLAEKAGWLRVQVVELKSE